MQIWSFTSESVSEGHPDKMADQISDALLDAFLGEDPKSRVAIEVLLTTGLAVIGGEVRSEVYVDIPTIVRQTIIDIGYDNATVGCHGETCGVMVCINEQSPEIAAGVNKSLETRVGSKAADARAKQGAGDQGMMFGYACNETPELMPMPINLAHRLAERLAEVRRKGTIPYLRPDAKTQVTIEYEDNRPVRLANVLISTQHNAGIDRNRMIKPDLIDEVLTQVIPSEFLSDFDLADGFSVNPSGSFERGGPAADAGLTGRKIIVDTYGGMARHGGGAFSGKDPSKVDRSAAYAARWVAKHVVASGAATRCEVQVAYAIGVSEPVSLMVETFGTETVDRAQIEAAINEIFDLRPGAIVEDLDLLRPIYKPTAAYGHFGRPAEDDFFTWERLDRLEDFKSHLPL